MKKIYKHSFYKTEQSFAKKKYIKNNKGLKVYRSNIK